MILNIVGDQVIEQNKTIEFLLSNPTASAGFSATIPGVTSATTTINNDDSAGILIQEIEGSTNVTEGGIFDTYQISLTGQPTAHVTITLITDNQVPAIPTVLTFTPTNWNLTQMITVEAVDDNLLEGIQSNTVIKNINTGEYLAILKQVSVGILIEANFV